MIREKDGVTESKRESNREGVRQGFAEGDLTQGTAVPKAAPGTQSRSPI